MNTYHLFRDEKVATWERTYCTVEAETLEEAIQKCLDDEVEDSEMEVLSDSLEYLTPEENHGYATVEVVSADGDSVCGEDILYSNSNRTDASR